MAIDLTPAVTRALAAAQRWAQELNSIDVEPRHLLLGLIEEEEGRAALLLRDQGLRLPAVREKLSGQTCSAASLGAPTETDAPPPTNPYTQHLLTAARWLAIDLAGETSVASEHLMISLLQHDAAVRQSLEPLGFSLQKLELQLRSPVSTQPIRLEEPLDLLEPADQVDSARIIDANANRAREALRVLEDYCRFVLDDAFLSREWKQLRHDLAEAIGEIAPVHLLESRETIQDVGTLISLPSEEHRPSLLAVVQANCKRLQEACRSLEEYGKLRSPGLGRIVEAVRYRSYTLERALVLGKAARDRLAEARLYVLVTRSQCAASVEWTIKEAAAGGARIIQLREKAMQDQEWLAYARAARGWTRAAGVLFIMNDRPDIARLAEADGVHLGQEDMSVKDARRIAGPEMLIGVSTHNIEQVRQAVLDGANYLGVGPTFPSSTKEFEELAGLEFVRQAAAETSLPAFAIGGITAENVHQIVEAGLRRVAVSQAICQADDPQAIAASIRRSLQEYEPVTAGASRTGR